MPGSAGYTQRSLAATLGPFHAERSSTGHGRVGLNQPHQIGQTSVMAAQPRAQGPESAVSFLSQISGNPNHVLGYHGGGQVEGRRGSLKAER